MFRRALLWRFGIAEWHLASAANKPYVSDVIAYLNARNIQVVGELGCGLGDIVSGVTAQEKYGFDTDPGVIRAARLLARFRRDRTKYSEIMVRADNLPSVTADAWVLVNWTHHMAPRELQSIVRTLLTTRVNNGGCLVIDSIEPGDGHYSHDPHDLVADLPCSVTRIGGNYAFGRTLYALERHPGSH